MVALGLVALYEILVWVVGDITKELWKGRWRDRIVDQLDQKLTRRMSRFDGRYRQLMLNTLRIIDLRALETKIYDAPELDEVFVDVSLAGRGPHQVPGDLLADLPIEVTERKFLGDFLDGPRSVALAVTGAPGSGKTTLLRYTARDACRSSRKRKRTVPVLLYLRDHVTEILLTPGVPLSDLVRRSLDLYHTTEPKGWFEHRLQAGKCVVLLDGLDEVARPEDRRAVATWVERQMARYPQNDYVITSRPHGFHAAPINNALVLQVRPFTDEQITRFVRGWYFAVERCDTGAGSADIQLAKIKADDLLKRLRDSPALYELAVNPLLLTMIANVHRERGKLPGRRADLYREIFQVMLGRWQQAKDIQVVLEGEKKEALLSELAFTMMRKRLLNLPRADVLTKISSALRKISTEITAEEFLADIGANGLLIEHETGVYSFAHPTFQEYLAATHIRRERSTNVLISAVNDAWWREATLLYTAKSKADPIIKACLDSGSPTALALAFDCAEQSNEAEQTTSTLRSRIV
jgi:predicted NACHT family NTPase